MGVLFVHGIGRQRRTQTLARCAGPLCNAVARLMTPAGSAGRTTRVTVSDAWLSALRSEAASDARAQYSPASVGLIFTEPRDGRQSVHRWLLAESLWAGSPDFPQEQGLIKWLLGLIERVLNGLCEILRIKLLQSKSPEYNLPVFANLFPHHACYRIAYRAKQNIGSRKGMLVSFIGDCLAGYHDLQARVVLIDTVNADLAWLSSRCHRVVVVAHSLGAAIAADVLNTRGIPDNLALLVTYGASIPKRHRIPAEGLHDKMGVQPSLAAIGTSSNSEQPTGLGVSIPWLNFAADRDPFAGFPVPQSVHVRVRNERSMFTNHWGYWCNTEEFVIPLIAALVRAEAGSSPSQHPPR